MEVCGFLAIARLWESCVACRDFGPLSDLLRYLLCKVQRKVEAVLAVLVSQSYGHLLLVCNFVYVQK